MELDRRSFLNQGTAALAGTALSYSRILGANERISLGHIGVGSRGTELAWMAAQLKDKKNVEMTAVCDLWRINRGKAAAGATAVYGRAPRAFEYFEDLLALKDVDAVLISTPDFTHSMILKLTAEAGKDAYCEKPMGNVLEEAMAARDAVVARKLVVQVGTQHRSEPYQIATRDLIRTGALGEVSKYEVVWNYHGPRWRGRPEVKLLREEDTDWKRWLMHKRYRPFDPRVYLEFRLYKEFSSGIADQWMSHAIDLAHFFMEDEFPKSVMAHGGVFAWPDGRENPDTFQALFEYPKGFLVSYSTSFGNDSDSFTRIMGKKATLINVGGEGSQRWELVEEKGTHEDHPFIQRKKTFVTLAGSDKPGLPFISDTDLSHMTNWFDCLRSRQQPNATVRHGFAHSVAVIMAARAYREGRKLFWNRETETIGEQD
ncbi:MAG TPA: Gfo/Idh/MocA family oxidoreductase [Bryobacteraceae bacterium]|nr:Gfo/Idh/MocA family oxidoreductase [Bryobacteraceae bacterium]